MTNTAKVIPFHFDKIEVRTLLINNEPWFVAADIAAALDYRMAADMTRNLDSDERGTQIVRTPSKNQHGDFGTVDQEMLVINESGLYSAILRSRKPEAKRFKKWVTAEVLPAIRRHGHYQDTRGRMETLLGQTIGPHGFKMLNAVLEGKLGHLPVKQRQAANQHIWAQVHTAFGVSQGADIPAEQLDSARNFIAAYTVIEGEWLPKEPETLTPEEQHSLSEIVHRKAAPYAELQGKAQAEIWSRLHNKFRIAKYSQLPRAQLTEAIVYVGQMELRLPLPVQDESTKEQRTRCNGPFRACPQTSRA